MASFFHGMSDLLSPVRKGPEPRPPAVAFRVCLAWQQPKPNGQTDCCLPGGWSVVFYQQISLAKLRAPTPFFGNWQSRDFLEWCVHVSRQTARLSSEYGWRLKFSSSGLGRLVSDGWKEGGSSWASPRSYGLYFFDDCPLESSLMATPPWWWVLLSL